MSIYIKDIEENIFIVEQRVYVYINFKDLFR